MNKFLIVFCSITLVTVLTLFAYNSDKGPAKREDGIAELPGPKKDSLLQRGKQLLNAQAYTDGDLEAIAAYLETR